MASWGAPLGGLVGSGGEPGTITGGRGGLAGTPQLGGTPDEQAPTWADDAQLTVERSGQFRARVTWPQAMDRSLVVEYSVFQDDVLVAVVPGDVNEVTIGRLSPFGVMISKSRRKMTAVISAKMDQRTN